MKRNTLNRLGFLCLALVFTAGALFAQASANTTQTITYSVDAINAISVSAGPTLILSPVAGEPMVEAIDESSTYSITTNGTLMKVTGALLGGEMLPAEVNLYVWLSNPGTEVFAAGGEKELTMTADIILLSGISQFNGSGKIRYRLTVPSTTLSFAATIKEISFTIFQGS